MRRHIPSTRALLIFDAVARHHGVGKAAEELCLTHSAVSQQLRLLESQIGVRLVQRTARGTELTEAGRRYHGQVSGDLLRLQNHTLEAMAQRADGLRLLVGAVPVLAEGWLTPRLP
jgi:DNA-binding transcriptional LysR family regulator